MRRLRILTWHVHGSYLYYLSRCPHDFYLPVTPDRSEPGYHGRTPSYPWPENVIEAPIDRVGALELDCVLFQSVRNYEVDQHRILSAAQRRLPRIFLEHDPPRESPTDTRHAVDDPGMLLVHVTPFNKLMWDSNRTPAIHIDHGVWIPEAPLYTGELARGIAVVNNLAKRGRRLGSDIFCEARRRVPLDLVGIDAESSGGLGEIRHADLPAFLSRYRFFFNPIRYTSLGLAVCEAMMLGLPVVGLATTEMSTVIDSGRNGIVHTDPAVLEEAMRELLRRPGEARRLGANARRTALERFGIGRFVADWNRAFSLVTGSAPRFSGTRRRGSPQGGTVPSGARGSNGGAMPPCSRP